MSEGLHILVIDDDPQIRELLCTILRADDHHVFDVGSAEEGLELLPYTTFQVVFLDHNLPGMDGLVLGQYLRRNNPELAIALVTGSKEELSKAAKSHGIRVVAKPFDVTEIKHIVDETRARLQSRLQSGTDDLTPPVVDLGAHAEDLGRVFDIPRVPDRIAERLVRAVKDSLRELRSDARYNERDRAVAYAGLLTLTCLGIDIPKNKQGQKLTEAYDEVMQRRGAPRVWTEVE